MSYRLIALDLDGTLLNRHQEITPRTRTALREAHVRGIATVIATGRTAASALHWSRQIGADPVICCNGGGIIESSGEYILTKPIPPAPLAALLEVCRELGLLVECYTPEAVLVDRPIEHARVYLRWVRPHLSTAAALRSLLGVWRTNRIKPVGNLLATAKKEQLPPVLKLMVVGPDAPLQKLSERVNRIAPSLVVTSSDPGNVEITAAGATKGGALQLLAARLKVPRQAILAIGDSNNDVSMLEYAQVGIAMGNASDELKAMAGRVAPSCDEDGVAAVIEELCLQD